jgi:hypothetical protein
MAQRSTPTIGNGASGIGVTHTRPGPLNSQAVIGVVMQTGANLRRLVDPKGANCLLD